MGSRVLLEELLPPGMTLLAQRCSHEDGEPLGMLLLLLHSAGSFLPLPKPSCDFSKSHFLAREGGVTPALCVGPLPAQPLTAAPDQ